MITKNKITVKRFAPKLNIKKGDQVMVISGDEKGKKGETMLAMKTVLEPKPINIIEKASVESFDEMKPELVFIFHKTESIDSLINMLQDCKAEMLS